MTKQAAIAKQAAAKQAAMAKQAAAKQVTSNAQRRLPRSQSRPA
jgi:hypothetical protein